MIPKERLDKDYKLYGKLKFYAKDSNFDLHNSSASDMPSGQNTPLIAWLKL